MKSDVFKHEGREGRIDSAVLSHLKEHFPLYIVLKRSDTSLSFAINFITDRRNWGKRKTAKQAELQNSLNTRNEHSTFSSTHSINEEVPVLTSHLDHLKSALMF